MKEKWLLIKTHLIPLVSADRFILVVKHIILIVYGGS